MRGAGDRWACRKEDANGTPPGARCVSDGIDQGRGAVVNGGHAHAERLRVVQPAGDVVDGAERQVEPEPGADGVGDGLGDHFADVPRHPGARVMRHRVGELVGEGRGHIGAGAMTLRVPADPDRRGVMEVVAVAGGAGQRIVRARGNGEIARVGVSGRRDRMEPPVSCAETHWSATPDWLQAGRRLLWESTLCRNRLSAILISSC